MADDPKVKGVAFRSVYTSLGKLRGERVQHAALERMNQPLRDGFGYGSIVTSGWYAIELYRELFHVIRDVTQEGKELVHEIGRQCTRDDMSGVYKMIAKLISPETLFSLSQRVFSNYYSVGTVQVVESRHGFTRARWSGCRGFDENMWTELIGSCEQLLEIGGARNVRQHLLSGGGEADESLELSAHWS
jgi:hypothetical protein